MGLGGKPQSPNAKAHQCCAAVQRRVVFCPLIYEKNNGSYATSNFPCFCRFFSFLQEAREIIKDTRPKTNTTRGGRKAHRPTPKTRTIHPPSSRTVSSGRVVGGRPQTPARLGVANPPGPISVSVPTRDTAPLAAPWAP